LVLLPAKQLTPKQTTNLYLLRNLEFSYYLAIFQASTSM